MKRLFLFLTVSLFLIMAALPFRMKSFNEYGHGHAAVEEENYFACLDELKKLKAENAEEEAIQRCMLKVARALAVLRQYRAADRMYRDVWQARANSNAAYDETFVAAVIGLAGLRRDMGNMDSSTACYLVALEYDKKHLQASDMRVTRDKNNLAVSYLIAAKTAQKEVNRMLFLRSAAGLFNEVISEHQARSPQGSLREANARQDLAYVFKELHDRRGYEKELRAARNMQQALASRRVCFEP
ncbi:MAG TPA: hypothetical protein EYN91_07840 [Candidatus Melainabacteria bacterium]|jgi:hypothetical protein|nr:hypothetical protein [Candidatus Melainabacteria bacterium]HIN64604.1 hypothetical protein [Candidatus Obscuribacterales bacterium]